MTTPAKLTAWTPERVLEATVAAIRKAFQPDAGVQIRIRVRDRAVTSKREVDVLVTVTTPTSTRRIGFECRHHRRKVNVEYLDQMVTKRTDLGLDMLHVVSVAGFTRGAREKADYHGIGLSLVEALEHDAWAHTALGMTWNAVDTATEVVFLKTYFLVDTPDGPAFLRWNPTRHPEALGLADGCGTPVESVGDYVLRAVQPVAARRLVYSPEAVDHFALRMVERRLILPTGDLRPLHEICVSLRFRRVQVPTPITSVGYRALAQAVGGGRVGTFQFQDMLVAVATPDDQGVTAISFWLPRSAGRCTRHVALVFTGDEPHQREEAHWTIHFDGSGQPRGILLKRATGGTAG